MNIIEKNGVKLEHIVVKKVPYRGGKCGRLNCMISRYKSKTNKGMDCTKPNALYEVLCLQCEVEAGDVEVHNLQIEDRIQRIREVEAMGLLVTFETEGTLQKIPTKKIGQYIGETCKSVYHRSKEHTDGYRLAETSNLMMNTT